MTEAERKALRELLQRRAEEHTRTPEIARQWLIDEGLYDADGVLQPQYGGPKAANDT